MSDIKVILLTRRGMIVAQPMARLVSLTVSIAVEEVLGRKVRQGVSVAPSDGDIIHDWLSMLKEVGEDVILINRQVDLH